MATQRVILVNNLPNDVLVLLNDRLIAGADSDDSSLVTDDVLDIADRLAKALGVQLEKVDVPVDIREVPGDGFETVNACGKDDWCYDDIIEWVRTNVLSRPATENRTPLQQAAVCALADLVGMGLDGALEHAAEKSTVELYDALVAEGVNVSDYANDVADIREEPADED